MGDASTTARLASECYPLFYDFLEACQEYAALTGGRFLKGSKALPPAAQEALAKAQPVIDVYRQRLLRGEEELLNGIDGAVQLVMKEAVREGIVATCRELKMWPPSPAPRGVDSNDCAYETTSSPLPVIAQRAYNDEQRRLREAAASSQARHSVTASFLADFAGEIGVSKVSESHGELLREFMVRVEEWSSRHHRRRAGRVGAGTRAGACAAGVFVACGVRMLSTLSSRRLPGQPVRDRPPVWYRPWRGLRPAGAAHELGEQSGDQRRQGARRRRGRRHPGRIRNAVRRLVASATHFRGPVGKLGAEEVGFTWRQYAADLVHMGGPRWRARRQEGREPRVAAECEG